MPAGEVGTGDVADFAGVDEGVERIQRLLDGREAVEAVHVVDVNVVGAQSLEAGVALFENVQPRGAEVVGAIAHGEEGLGGDEDLVALSLESLAENLLRQAVRVAVGYVEEVHAGIEAEVDHAPRFVDAGVAPRSEEFVATAKGCGAETERRDLESGTSKKSVFHTR